MAKKSAPTPGHREAAIPCPSCGTPTTGRFCSACGATVGNVPCGKCGTPLTPGAKFCHDCGASAGAASGAASRGATARHEAPSGPSAAQPRSNLPFVLAGFAFVVLVVIFAAQRADQGAPAPTAAGGAAGPMAGPDNVDVSSMTPRERANRLFDRIMRLQTEGKQDSVQFFSSMVPTVYESLGTLDADLRYDYGRIGEVSGNLDLAQAQADTILQQDPDHLLGLVLSIAVANARAQADRRASLERRLLAAEPSQRARGLQEYSLHQYDIDAALTAARARR